MNSSTTTGHGATGFSEREARTRPAPTKVVRRRSVPWAWLAALLVLLVVVFGAYRTATRPTAVRTTPATVASIRAETAGPGTVQARYAVSLGFQASGKLERVFVDVGDEVTKGQVLATLDGRELNARAAVARAAVKVGEGRVAQAVADSKRLHAQLALAVANQVRGRALFAEGLLSAADLDSANAALAVANANVLTADAASETARAELARLAEDARVADVVASYATLNSPMAGVITRRALEPGSAIAPNVTVLQLVDPSSLWVATMIDEALVGGVAVGQASRIRLRSGKVVQGLVVRVAFEADPVTRELEVDVGFTERPSRFAIHEEADVVILGPEARALTVPNAALLRAAGSDAVFVLVGSRAERRAVRVGAVGGDRAEIVDGLREGEAVILEPRAVRDGVAVRVAPAGGG